MTTQKGNRVKATLDGVTYNGKVVATWARSCAIGVELEGYDYSKTNFHFHTLYPNQLQPLNAPEYGKQYALTSKKGTPSIMQGNTWTESEVK